MACHILIFVPALCHYFCSGLLLCGRALIGCNLETLALKGFRVEVVQPRKRHVGSHAPVFDILPPELDRLVVRLGPAAEEDLSASALAAADVLNS